MVAVAVAAGSLPSIAWAATVKRNDAQDGVAAITEAYEQLHALDQETLATVLRAQDEASAWIRQVDEQLQAINIYWTGESGPELVVPLDKTLERWGQAFVPWSRLH